MGVSSSPTWKRDPGPSVCKADALAPEPRFFSKHCLRILGSEASAERVKPNAIPKWQDGEIILHSTKRELAGTANKGQMLQVTPTDVVRIELRLLAASAAERESCKHLLKFSNKYIITCICIDQMPRFTFMYMYLA